MDVSYTKMWYLFCLFSVLCVRIKGLCTKSSCTSQGEICINNKHGEPRCICRPRCKIKVPAIELRYMCGSDGYPYRNLCELDRTACLLGINIQPLYMGKCVRGSLHVSLKHQPKQNFTAGSSAELNCQFTGSPLLIEWFKQGSSSLPETARVRGKSLVFSKITKEDAGIYVCRASDAAGKQASTKIDVTIKVAKPSKPSPAEPKQCFQQSSYGRCAQVLVRWYFDNDRKDCIPFVYSGCGGNTNRFESKQACRESCVTGEVSNGVCPGEQKRDHSCPSNVRHRCNKDNECQHGLKCCLSNCIKHCMPAVVKVKPGKCPRPTLDTVECQGNLQHECQNDYDCEGDRKCCIWATGCERVCIEPLRQVKKCKRILDLAFLIDSSGSIRPQEWPQVIKFVKAVLERFDVSEGRTHVGVISYSTNSYLHFRFNTIKGRHRAFEVQNLVNDIPRLRGYTFPYKALELANNELFSARGGMRERAKKVIIMIIHGRQTTTQGSVVSLDVASKPLKNKGVDIWAVGIGNGVSQTLLRDIATDPSKTFAVSYFSSIFDVLDKIVPKICKETDLTPCQTEYRRSINNNNTFIPRCTSDGSYSNIQCQDHVCYCVDVNGRQIQGTETRIEAGKPRCSKAKNKLTDCQRAYAKAIINPELGQHIPRCKVNGMYEEVQCDGKTRDCWCVDIQGQMLPGTRTNFTLQCPPHADSNKLLTDCQKRYFEVSRNPVPGQYLPWCTPEGKYRWLQCHDSYCFCVNKNGDEIRGTRLRSEAGLPNCTAQGASLTPCQRQHIRYGDRFFYPGRYSPTCKSDGRYEEVQCHPSIGTCWCVDVDGLEVYGTKKWGSVSCTSPKKPLTVCQKRYQESQRSRIKGGLSPWCDAAGQFEPMQCFGPDCYCVDSNGATIEGTLVSIVQGRPDCNQPKNALKRSHCQVASESGVKIGIELHNPKCTWSGSYERIQCRPFSRQCWCVNSYGKEILGTRSTEVVRCPIIGGDLTKCQLEYQDKNRHWFLEGRFVPWCSIDGHYQLYQCHRSYCYCVSRKHGVEAYRSRMEISHGDAICSSPDSDSECEGQRKAAVSGGLLGAYKPRCKPDGEFHEVQCQGSVCFCVNKRGTQIPGTRVAIGSKPQCQSIDSILSSCERAVQDSLYRSDIFVPRCSNDGEYQDVQCDLSSCWCVDRNGQEIKGTRNNDIVTCPGKGAYSSSCWKEYQTLARHPPSLGRYVPQCGPDGNYLDVQCHRGYCFCVDTKGFELKGFSVDVGLHGKPVCKNKGVKKSDCQKKRMAAMMANPSVVAYLPDCKPDGTYSDVQCDRLSKECWCADADGAELTGTRTNGTLRCITRKTGNQTLCGRTFFSRSGPIIGLWNHVSVCYVNGFYRPIQCDGHKGYCWCVSENGKPSWNTVTRSIPDCSVDAEMTTCQEHRARLLGISGASRPSIYVPQCKQNGDYEQIQCHTIENVLYCWCVDGSGIEMRNTRQRGRPRNCLPRPDESQCRLQVQNALRSEATKGRFVPRCQSNGDFEEVQCNEWTGYCWCVDRSGKEIQNTKTKDFLFCPGLARDLTNCQREYQEAERDKFTIGHFMPRCTPEGEYVPIQCQESECYCVNDYGHEIYGTRLRMPTRPNCTNAASRQTECEYRREAASANAFPGASIPQCTPNGGYDKVQCRGSSCYCVDQRGNEIPGTTLAIADGKPKCDNPAIKLSLCQRQYQEYWRNPISGRYVPRCDSTGQFESVQCYGAYCFCVDSNGVEKQGTRVLQTMQPIDCSDIKKPLTPCQSLLAKRVLEPPKPGHVIPRCGSDGSFLPVQCDPLEKNCWCVNSTNHEIPGSRKKGFVQCTQLQGSLPLQPQCISKNDISHFKRFSPECQSNSGFQPLQCDFRYGYCWCSDVNGNWAPYDVVRGRASCSGSPEVTVCKNHRLRVLGPTGVAQPGAFIPQCLEDGNYDRVQCDGSSSFCWCVDENGFEEPGSREFGQPNCESSIGLIGQTNGHNKRIEAPCHQARQRVLGLSEVPSPGVFIPECDTDGSFKAVQCHSSTGFCWCADQYGQERLGTRTQGKPQCGPVGNLTACQRDRMRSLGWNGRFIVGLAVPRCRPDGSFEPVQCQESNGQCWCVDVMGNELAGTRSSAQITCTSQVGMTSCQKAKQTTTDVHNSIKCDDDGSYSPKRCSIGNGQPRQCWCVDRHGKEIPRTRTTGGINCDDISAGLTKCQRERQITLGWSGVARPDAFVPDCTADGGYEKIQCHETTGFCWCVDGNGNELVETRMRGRPVCERKVSRSSCLMERQRALGWSRNHNGAFVPQCRDDGRYGLIQCHYGTCWCVDEFGYELPETRKVSGTPDCNIRPAYFTECYQWRTRIIGITQKNVLSGEVFVPECDSKGNFITRQCSLSTGYCWCVDSHGNVLADTYTRGEQLDCDNQGSLTKCQKERSESFKTRSRDSLSEAYVPVCTKSGGYRPNQCDNSLGQCWCVNHLGIEESRTRVKAQAIVCELPAGLTPCQQEQRRSYGFVDKPPKGRFVPKCKPDGSYDDIQCQDSGYCWCVDLEGIEVLGTRRKGRPLCFAAARLSKCQAERELSLGPNNSPLLGEYVPKCRRDGSYEEIQCDRRVGECWCVDDNGRERTGTRQIGKPVDCFEEVFSLCRRERHRALGWTGLQVPALFVPECKLDGTYETIQCHVTTGYCWCVDRWGHEWPGTRIMGEPPDCRKAMAVPTSCHMDQSRALIWSEQFSSLYGVFSPDCTLDGRYKPVQCNTKTGYCWCVDGNGNEIWGTRVRGERPDCNNLETNITECSKSTEEGQNLRRINFYLGRFVPKCDSYGGYEPVQCDQGGYCWCVDRYGQELPRTKVKGLPQTCGLFAGTTSCQRESYLSMSLGGNLTPGRFKAECERDGRYKRVQCDKTSGFCWCVDENGIEIPRSQSARDRPACGIMAAPLTQCRNERFRSLPWKNKFAPRCNDNGSYPQLQCFGAFCWCVDKYGNEIARTRTREKITCSFILPEDYETTCQARQRKSQSSSLAAFVPVCDRTGGYHPVQCLEGSPYCWCVDKYGNEIPRTRSKTVPQCHDQAGLTICQKERQIAIGWTGIASPGQFVPKCKPDGSYQLVQCHVSTGFCWCVDKDGNELPTTRTRGRPTCALYDTLTSCLSERERALGTLGEAPPGRFVPSCTATGRYLPTQCHQSIGYCWCVDNAGRELPNTRRKGKAYCVEQETISACNLEQKFATALSIPNVFYPSCELDGNYKEIQCRNQREKNCWCVDENGNTIAGTETNGQPNCTNGELKYTQCKLERFNSLVRRLKHIGNGDVVFVPQCKGNGGYDDIQCYRGECWCVNHRGVEIPGTRTRGKPHCQLPVCIQERMNAISYHSMPGRFVPKCKQDGSYADMQCHSASGYCWCADELGREIPETRVRGKPICGVKDGALTICQKQRKLALRSINRGPFIPRCNPDGSFAPTQCHESYCYCVDKNGEEIQATRVKIPQKPDCKKLNGDRILPGKRDSSCLPRYRIAMENFAINRFIPQCLPDGTYQPVQCDEGWYSCWCVDRYGNELVGTRTTGWPTCSGAEALPEESTQCQREYHAALNGYIYGRYVPRCQPDGTFEPMQCHSSLCFCVNKYGVEIDGTREPGLKPLKCKSIDPITKCQKQFRDMRSKYSLGTFVPRCLADGSFALVQCNPSNFCWCVDKEGREISRTRTKGWPACGKKEKQPSMCHKEFKATRINSSTEACAPLCQPDTGYDPMQCHAGVCFCVDRKGKEIRGTATPLPKTPKCLATDRILSACQRLYELAVQRHVVSRWIPNCRPDGTFDTVQCDRGWYCWCVDKGGKELPGTRKRGWPECGVQVTELGPCRSIYVLSLKQLVPGRFIPRCRDDGSFDPVQCFGSVCMCVDKYGVEVPGTTKPRFTEPDCSPLGWTLTPCQRHYQQAQRFSTVNQFVPTCDLDGMYNPIQCYGNICFCVDEDGIEILNSRTNLPQKPICSKNEGQLPNMPCTREKTNAIRNKDLNTFVPRCRDDGSYHEVQCRGMMCYCVDSKGNEKRKTRTPRPLRPNCYGPLPSKCQREYLAALSDYQPGRYIPRCTPNGIFDQIQFRSGYSHCVDSVGQEVLGTTTLKPFNPRCKTLGAPDRPRFTPRRCSSISKDSASCTNLTDQCKTDEECPNEKKCCFNGCNNACVIGVLERSADTCSKAMDLAISINASPNMTRCSWTRILDFLKTLVSHFDVSKNKVNIGIVSYSVSAKVENDFKGLKPVFLNVEEIQRIIGNVFWTNGKSRMDKGVKTVDEKLFNTNKGMRSRSLKVFLLIEDGGQSDSSNQETLSQVSKSLKSKGVNVFALSTGDTDDKKGLSFIVSSPENIFQKSLTNLHEVVRPLAKSICSEKKCEKVFDIAFVVDASDSIGRVNWFIKKQFIKRILNSFKIKQDGVHVAVIMYSTEAEIILKFNTLDGDNLNEDKVLKKIEMMEWRKGFTFIDKALEMANREVFVTSAGMRTDVPKILLVLTDGKQSRDQGSYTEPSVFSDKIKGKGVSVYSIGIGNIVDKEELKTIASDTTKVVLAKSFVALQELAGSITDSVCQGAVTRSGTCPRNWKGLFGRTCDGRLDKCKTDNQCPPNMKCCSSGCHKQCVKGSLAFALPVFGVCEANQNTGIISCKCEECPKNKTDPVCGSNNRTYPNECMMRQDSCKKNKTISVKSKGSCDPCKTFDCSSPPYSSCEVVNNKAVCACRWTCSVTINRVCGSDGITYDNLCQMKRAACRSNKMIKVRRKGHCNACYKYDCSSPPYSSCEVVNDKAVCACRWTCSVTINRVCGSDGITYDNLCQMKRAACRSNKMIKVRRKGHCNACYKYDCSSPPYSSCEVVNDKAVCACRWNCSATINRVCGSDGITYDNLCQMKRAACRSNKMITVRRKGHCNACYKYDCSSPPYSSCEVVNDKAVCACRWTCSVTINRVCGSDGITYDNLCQMKRAACRSNKMITVRRKGHCNACYKYDCSSPPYSSCEVVNDKAVCACRWNCSATINRVCGSDGITYDNLCQMKRAACRSNKMITVRRKGHCNACYKYECSSPPYSRCEVVNDKPVCGCSWTCSTTISYVCGSDGNTYDNECLMRKAACRSNKMITVLRKGHCNACYKYECSSPPYSRCEVVNDKPVCGCSWICSTAISYVCGSDGNTYDNECLMRRAACRSRTMITVRRKGHCNACYKYECSSPPYSKCEVVNDKPVCGCFWTCSTAISYVCGSDGNTYDNECLMRKAACRSNKMITVLRKGHCNACYKYECSAPPYSRCEVVNDKPVCGCSWTCSTTISYVCGSDGNTYDNECLMRKAACRSKKMITVRRKGHCNACYKYECSSPPYSRCEVVNDKPVCGCSWTCSTAINYVCGSDGNTYDNECLMRRAACRSNKMITLRRKGHCNACYKYECSSPPYSKCEVVNDKPVCGCSWTCSTSISYVCGSDGNTYDNECLMRRAACRNKTMITVRRKGHCNLCFKYDCSSPIYSSCKVINDKPVCVCPTKCSTSIDHVCGSDANTYDNECQMRKAACRSNKMITVRRKGHCDPCFKFNCESKPYSSCKAIDDKAVCVCPAICPSNIDRVCGSDGTTYDNECLMRQAACRSNRMITVRRKGHCDPCFNYDCAPKPYSKCKAVNDKAVCACPDVCPTNIDRVCGTDENTYDNECLMRQASCKKGIMITVRKKGYCDPCIDYNCAKVRPFSTCKAVEDKPECECPVCKKTPPDYVCANIGQHYRSECSMHRASCKLNQTLTVVSKGKCVCNAVVDLGILVDSSGSIGRRNWARMKEFVNSVIKSFKVGSEKSHVATIAYSTEPAVIFKFNTLRGSEITAEAYGNLINRMRWQRGFTYIDKALLLADAQLFNVKDGMRTDVAKILLVITDGIQTKQGKFTPLAEASKHVKKKGVRVYAMGIGKSVARDELEDIASNRNRDVFLSESFSLLKPKVQEIIDKVCFPDPCDTFVCSRPYSHCELDDESPTCICPKSCPKTKEPVCGSDGVTYDNKCVLEKTSCERKKSITLVENKPCKCKIVVDLVFVVDSSGSIGRRNWGRMKQFLNQIISEFDVGEEGTHVAIVSYSTTAKVEFKFNTLRGSSITADAYGKMVSAMGWQRGYTFIDKGLSKANLEVLTTAGGLRQNVDKVCMVITDGIQTKDQGPYTPLNDAILPIKNKGFRVYSLGIGKSVEKSELQQMASDPVKNVFSAASFKELKIKVRDIMGQLCRNDPEVKHRRIKRNTT